MFKIKLKQRRLVTLASACVLALSGLLPIVATQTASAANQLTDRSITISTSKISATSVTYSASFKAASTSNVLGVVIDICQDSPLINTACSTTNGVTATPTTGNITVSKTGAAPTSVSMAVHANSTSTGQLILSDATGFTSVAVGDIFTLSFTATNPSGTVSTPGAVGTFYGRILTYSSTASAAGYTHLNASAVGAPVDQGGLAMSTSNQLSTTARVQEQLSFCVGGTTVDDATSSIAANCASPFTGTASCGSGTTIDLGVLDNTAVNVSPVSVANNGNGCNGAAMVQTNAANGVTITYFAEPNGTFHTGALRVTGATCANPGSSNTDQCFNSSGTQGVFAKGTENYGVTVGGINCASVSSYTCNFSTSTYNMARDTDYDGDGTTNTYDSDNNRIVAANTTDGYAWNDSGNSGSPVNLSSSSASGTKVVDNEALVLKFAATAGITTPTGQYSVVSTYIATPVY